jgi:hypothetical protein
VALCLTIAGKEAMRMRAGSVIAAFLLFAALPAAPAGADKLTEENMTAKDFKDITSTESSVPGEYRIEPPLEVHDFSTATEQAVKDAHGVRVIRGRDWKRLSPMDRDKRMRELRKTMQRGTFFMIEVPSGNVWAIDADEYFKLKDASTIHRWTYEQQEKLPKAVKRDPGTSQSDRSGTALERALTREEEP